MKCCISDVKMKGDRSLPVQTKRRGKLLNPQILPLTSSRRILLFKHVRKLPFKVPNLLRVAHYLAEVDVEHVSTVLQHDIVVVAVADPEDEGGHTPTCT